MPPRRIETAIAKPSDHSLIVQGRNHDDAIPPTDLTQKPDSPLVRDGADKLVRRSYWMDMNDRTLVMVMVNGIGAHLANEERRAHLRDLRRDHLIDQVCVQEIMPPEK